MIVEIGSTDVSRHKGMSNDNGQSTRHVLFTSKQTTQKGLLNTLSFNVSRISTTRETEHTKERSEKETKRFN